ncbi:MAG: 4-(cytidine 5'-diphospho)-2-C-methyl-D-erythritol kinase [Rikenellaceae bacterium]|jgi:4-diphosphocytidyl-2-C-methyl-D-erythritol kinase|nr:4-(cytidine 5'-diphospho)-2-C-methyl-D-erythritol kinase [Rikenellaceae bacterium]
MILFPNAKINLGLHVLNRRPDGFHDIETLMFPVAGLCDAVEVIRSAEPGATFSASGLVVDCTSEKNLCVKACELLRREFPKIGGMHIHLHKIIPFGAGLGGGSADAVAVLRGLNALFHLALSDRRLEVLAAELGSDTVFFVRNVPAVATGRGEFLESFPVDLQKYWLLIVKPPVGVSTAEAYRGVIPGPPAEPLRKTLGRDPSEWQKTLFNDFEPSVFKKYPALADVKKSLYEMGALYASMSGSGSALFGLFREKPDPGNRFRNSCVFTSGIG